MCIRDRGEVENSTEVRVIYLAYLSKEWAHQSLNSLHAYVALFVGYPVLNSACAITFAHQQNTRLSIGYFYIKKGRLDVPSHTNMQLTEDFMQITSSMYNLPPTIHVKMVM